MKTNFLNGSLLLLILIQLSNSEVRIAQNVGFGTRALSFGNNYVALSNDLSALYNNPAALGFLPVREVSLSLDGQQIGSTSLFYDNSFDNKLQRFRFSSLGIVNAFPTSRGGFTIAGAFYNPVVFDDISIYEKSFGSDNSVSNTFKTSGGLSYWSGGFGVQIAKGLSAGFSGALVSGKDDFYQDYFKKVDGQIDTTASLSKQSGSYLGYDLRAGLMYSLEGKANAGLRFVFPQRIHLTNNYNDKYYNTKYYMDNYGAESFHGQYDGEMYTSYSGALGFSVNLPFMIVSTEARATLPFSWVFPIGEIPENSQANYTKLGGGVGLEIPVIRTPLLIRLGYSYDELDLHQFAIQYTGDDIDWSDDGVSVDKNRQSFNAGIGIVTQNLTFDLSYGFQTWGIETIDPTIVNSPVLHQDFFQNRVSASFALRY
jgi:hypothetical protein